VAIAEPRGEYYGGQVAAPVFGSLARQVLLYLGVRPERTPLAVWPGEKPGNATLMASLRSPAAPGGDFPDGEDPPEPPPPGLLLNGERGTPRDAAPESEHSSTSGGGRSHASF